MIAGLLYKVAGEGGSTVTAAAITAITGATTTTPKSGICREGFAGRVLAIGCQRLSQIARSVLAPVPGQFQRSIRRV